MSQRSERKLYDSGNMDVQRSAWPGDAPPCELPRLQGDESADVVVIGAGLAGSSLALHLAERGASVVVLEAHEPGWGASGRNAGHAIPYRDLDASLAKLPDGGEAFLALLREQGEIVYEVARKYDIACDAVQAGYMQVAHSRGLVAAAEKKAEKWAKRGFPIRFADRSEVEKRTGTRSFFGATYCETGGRVNPFLFTRGMVDAARGHGARVYAHSGAQSLARDGSRFVVKTEQGRVAADRVVVCTNGYTGQLVPALAEAWCPLVAFGLSTKPLPDSLHPTLLPDDVVISQFPTGTHPTLIDGNGRLVTSLLPSPIRPEASGPALAWFERWLHRMFPQTRDVSLELDTYWTGSMAWSTDELPRIFEVAPGLLALTCFSGEGNVIAPLLGRHLAETLTDDALDHLALPLSAPERPRWRGQYDVPLRKIAIPLMKLAERFRLY